MHTATEKQLSETATEKQLQKHNYKTNCIPGNKISAVFLQLFFPLKTKSFVRRLLKRRDLMLWFSSIYPFPFVALWCAE